MFESDYNETKLKTTTKQIKIKTVANSANLYFKSTIVANINLFQLSSSLTILNIFFKERFLKCLYI